MEYRKIGTVEELDALPMGSVIGVERYKGTIRVWTKEDCEGGEDDWYSLNHVYFDTDWLPALLLWIPEED